MVLSSISQSPLGIREMSMVQNRDSISPMKKSTTLTAVIKGAETLEEHKEYIHKQKEGN